MVKEKDVTIPNWDLSDLYQGLDDPQIEKDLQAAVTQAQEFAQKWRGRIATSQVSAESLALALQEYINLSLLVYPAEAFASLSFAVDTANPKAGALVQHVNEQCSLLASELVFFDLELSQIPSERWQAIADEPVLQENRHYLEYQRLVAKYQLSEPEEKILEDTANCRGRAFGRLFTELVSRLKYPFSTPASNSGEVEVKELTQSELLALSYSPDRSVRQQAATVLSQVLTQNAHPIHFTYNTLLLEKITMDRLRGFTRPEQSRNVSNEIADAAVDTMVHTVVENYPLVARYYELKRCLLGLDKLYHYDRYAPLGLQDEYMSFAQAKSIVLEAYEQFSPLLREIITPFFEKSWIDAQLAPHKRGGAFCAGIAPSMHPYVLMNYTGKPRDVMTLAHELGHGAHDCLASCQNLLNYHPVLPLAETASTFGEMLVFDKLQQQIKQPDKKLSLLCEKLEDTFATVFRQVAMYRFEQRVFAARKEQGELALESINAIWQECLQEMFGNSLTLGEEHRITWLYVPHFVHTPFYVYAYAFGELLVLSLYARFKREGEGFKEKYLRLLAAGGSESPAQLLQRLGIDIASAEFWQAGCDLIAQNIDQAYALAAQSSFAQKE